MVVCLMGLPWEELEPATHALVQKRREAVRRVEQLTAGVFAVAMTILVLQLAVPQLSHPPTETALQRSLLDMYPAFHAYVFSFVALLVYWVLHHFQFHYLTRASGGLIWLNALILAFVALLPFSTALVANYEMTRTAVLIYEGNIFAIQLVLTLLWKHATGSGLLFGGDTPPRVVQRMRAALRLGTIYVIAMMGLVFVDPSLSMNLLAVIGLYYIILTARGGYTLELTRRHPPQVL